MNVVYDNSIEDSKSVKKFKLANRVSHKPWGDQNMFVPRLLRIRENVLKGCVQSVTMKL